MPVCNTTWARWTPGARKRFKGVLYHVVILKLLNTINMTCVGLTEEDEKHLLMLLEGDISNVEIEDEDEINYENEINEKKSEFDDSIEEFLNGTIIPVGSNKINVEVE
ncbi:hypothetical protein FQA39_LY11133 [Lamprigera yunnana]|nr:hypothetical protein FQA39_LY11133 [Lamprigera yunnana]